MPDNNQTLELPPLDQAAALEQQIEQQVFFAKLAEAGIQPTTQEQADSMWRMGNLGVSLQQQPAVKQAAAQNDPFLLAEQKINEYLHQQGIDVGLNKAAEDSLNNQLAMAYAQNPDVYKAMLALENAERAA